MNFSEEFDIDKIVWKKITNVKKEIHNLKNYDKHIFRYLIVIFHVTVKLGFKERLNKEQLGNSEPFLVTNMPVNLTNNEQIGIIVRWPKSSLLPSLTVQPHAEWPDRVVWVSSTNKDSSPREFYIRTLLRLAS